MFQGQEFVDTYQSVSTNGMQCICIHQLQSPSQKSIRIHDRPQQGNFYVAVVCRKSITTTSSQFSAAFAQEKDDESTQVNKMMEEGDCLQMVWWNWSRYQWNLERGAGSWSKIHFRHHRVRTRKFLVCRIRYTFYLPEPLRTGRELSICETSLAVSDTQNLRRSELECGSRTDAIVWNFGCVKYSTCTPSTIVQGVPEISLQHSTFTVSKLLKVTCSH